MKRTVLSFAEFHRAFVDMDRTGNFTRDGLRVLFDYLEDFEDQTGQEIELDVIALCCEFSEETPADIADNYGINVSDCEDEDELMEAVLEYLNDETMVCGQTDSTIVYQLF